jgi:hypothetical protein
MSVSSLVCGASIPPSYIVNIPVSKRVAKTPHYAQPRWFSPPFDSRRSSVFEDDSHRSYSIPSRFGSCLSMIGTQSEFNLYELANW